MSNRTYTFGALIRLSKNHFLKTKVYAILKKLEGDPCKTKTRNKRAVVFPTLFIAHMGKPKEVRKLWERDWKKQEF